VRSAALAWIVAAVSLLVVVVIATLSGRQKPPETYSIRFAVLPPHDGTFGSAFVAPFQAISPNGQRIVFVAPAKDPSTNTLWMRSLDSMEPEQLRGTENATLPFWSPDSRFVAFFADGRLKRIEAIGGAPQTLSETPANEGGTWNREGIILLGHPHGGLFRVLASGGQPEAVTTLDVASGEASHRWPYFLPDGRHFLYIAGPPYRVYVGSLDSGLRKQLINSDSKAVYAPPGYVLFAKEDSLMAQPFDAAKLKLTGSAFPIAENIRTNAPIGRSGFSVSDNGVLTYRTA